MRGSLIGAVPRGKTGYFYRTADVLIFQPCRMVLVYPVGSTSARPSANRFTLLRRGVEAQRKWMLLDEPTARPIVEALRFCVANPDRLAAFSSASRIEDRFSIDAPLRICFPSPNSRSSAIAVRDHGHKPNDR